MRSSEDVSVNRRLSSGWVSLVASVLAVFVCVWAVGEVADSWLPSGPVLANGDEIFRRHWLGISLTLFAILFRKVQVDDYVWFYAGWNERRMLAVGTVETPPTPTVNDPRYVDYSHSYVTQASQHNIVRCITHE